MRAGWALFLLNLRATWLRHLLAPLSLVAVVTALLRVAEEELADPREAPFFLALLGILSFMQPGMALSFSPLEDLALAGRTFRRSWPLAPRSFGGAVLLASVFPGLATAFLGAAVLSLFLRGTLGSDGVLFAACFSARMALLGAALTSAGYWARLAYKERAWMRNGMAAAPFLIFAGITASRSAAGTKVLLGLFRLLSAPSPGIPDAIFLFLLVGVWWATARLDEVRP